MKNKSSKRILAENMYINSRGSMKLKDIAEEIGVSQTLVRKWKCEDKWEEKLKDSPPDVITQKDLKDKPSKRKKEPKIPSNSNAVKTGQFETIFYNTLTADEMVLVSDIQSDKAKELQQEISLLTVREHRILNRIKELEGKSTVLSSTRNSKIKEGSGIIKTDELTHDSIGTFEAYNRLENALSNVQEKKIKAIEILLKLQVEEEKLNIAKGIAADNAASIKNWLDATKPDTKKIESLFVDAEFEVNKEEEGNG